MNRLGKHEKILSTELDENDTLLEKIHKPSPHRKRLGLLSWLASSLCIFAVLYGSSYLALFWLPPYEGVDMRSQLTANYSGWVFLVFQPVDLAVIEEIRQERGLPKQMIIDGSFWPTPNGTNIAPLIESETPASPTLAAPDTLVSSATSNQPSHTSTPVLTSTAFPPETTIVLEAMETSLPSTNAFNTATTSKPRKTPRPQKTDKPPKDPKNK